LSFLRPHDRYLIEKRCIAKSKNRRSGAKQILLACRTETHLSGSAARQGTIAIGRVPAGKF
jgi:hypothetical protein